MRTSEPTRTTVPRRAAARLRTRTADAALLARLRTLDGRGSVHSAFRGVLNLLMPDGELMALAARGRENAPRTLVVDIAHWGGTGIVAGQTVEYRPGDLTLPDAGMDGPPDPRGPRGLWISVRDAAPWHPVLPSLTPLGPYELGAAARVLEQLLRRHGESGGMLGAPPAAAPLEAAVCSALARGREGLMRAIRAGDTAGTRTAILSLLGLGPGLTPAGDDFLTGLALLSALDGSRLGPYAHTLRDVLGEHHGRTTLLSTTTLREALSGRARAALVDVLHALAAPGGRSGEQLLDTARTPVLSAMAHGHTSGTDTLSGLAAGLRLEKELRGSL